MSVVKKGSHPMKACWWGVEVYLHAFLTSALVRDGGELDTLAALPTDCNTGWATQPVWKTQRRKPYLAPARI
jgi:hypothetical protein